MPVESSFRKLSSWIRVLLHRQTLDQELDDEIAYHLEERTEENMSKGMTPAEARRAARMELGGIEQGKERVRAQRAGAWFQSVFQDIRYGLRVLLKNWKASSVALLSLALAMGISVAALSVFNAIMLRPPRKTNPSRLLTNYAASTDIQSDSEPNA